MPFRVEDALEERGANGRIIRAEFLAGACLLTALGIVTLIRGTGAWIAVGGWLVGVGANYLPLTLEAQRLSHPGALVAVIRARRRPTR